PLGQAKRLPPLRRPVWFAPGLVEWHDPRRGSAQASSSGCRNVGLAYLETLVSADQHWFGLGVLLLPCQRSAEQAHGVEPRPIVWRLAGAGFESLARRRLSLGPASRRQVRVRQPVDAGERIGVIWQQLGLSQSHHLSEQRNCLIQPLGLGVGY